MAKIGDMMVVQVSLDLRDYFAGQALAGMLYNPKADSIREPMLAECAYDYADAMIQERERRIR